MVELRVRVVDAKEIIQRIVPRQLHIFAVSSIEVIVLGPKTNHSNHFAQSSHAPSVRPEQMIIGTGNVWRIKPGVAADPISAL